MGSIVDKNENTSMCGNWVQNSMNSECLVFNTGSHWCNWHIRFWLEQQVRGFDSIFNSHLVFLSLPAEDSGLEKVLTLGRVR